MKKFKRIVLSALAVAMLFCMMAMPASATKDFADSTSDRGKGTGLEWYAYLSVDGKTGYAEIIANSNLQGAVPALIEVRLEGEIEGGTQFEVLEAKSIGTPESSVTASDTKSLRTNDVTSAKCYSWANGESAAVLKLPKQ